MADFSWVHTDPYQKLFACLPDPSCMRFVGGSVRNTLLGLPFDDIDFATSYKPQEIMGFFTQKGYKVIPTGLAHGTVTVISGKNCYEITTLRRDVETDGRHARVAYTPVWEEDAQRRDFTMNALYLDSQGIVHDYVGGQKDIAQRLIRFIGDPEQRIREDYLRILRFFRFWALYGQDADPKGLKMCCQLKEHLAQLSSERITKEMLKLLSASNPWPVLRLMQKQNFDPLTWGHQGAATSIPALEILENLWGPADSWVRLAMVTGQMPKRLTLSQAQKKTLYALWTPLDNSRTIWHSVYDFGLPLTKGRIWMDALNAVATYSLDTRGELSPQLLADLTTRKRVIETLDHQTYPLFPLTGRDVMTWGVSGPEVGRVLQETKNWWIENHGKPSHQECIVYGQTRLSFS